jgi:hypothetical protein
VAAPRRRRKPALESRTTRPDARRAACVSRRGRPS